MKELRDIEVGDTVEWHRGYNGHSKEVTVHTVSRTTPARIMIDTPESGEVAFNRNVPFHNGQAKRVGFKPYGNIKFSYITVAEEA